jgi:hypothetical protein
VARLEVGFKGDGSITTAPGRGDGAEPHITLEAGAKGTINLHAKTISMEADEELSSKSKSISLKAKEKIEMTGKELLGTGTKKVLVSNQEFALNGGAK